MRHTMKSFLSRPLFGDTHLHTSFSFDAGLLPRSRTQSAPTLIGIRS
jgi:hypothetical protein